MIITFSKQFCAEPRNLADYVVCIVDVVSNKLYWVEEDKPAGNLYASITWGKGRRVRFVIATRNARAHGSRRAASGRHMCKASWEAHRDVMTALFAADPQATIRTGFATYKGLQHFRETFAATAHKNVGSLMHPVTIQSCSI